MRTIKDLTIVFNADEQIETIEYQSFPSGRVFVCNKN